MHTVDRGPPPPGLDALREKLTPKWVAYYRRKQGSKPTDAEWQRFQPAMSGAFFTQCGYCEEACHGDVDHFRPKNKFPEKVYAWDNWVLACHTCNQMKYDKWPPGGYVDPCAKTALKRPESYFDFDTKTGELLPQRGLNASRYRMAQQTRDDLKLNAYHHLKSRIHQVQLLTLALQGCAVDDPKAIALARLASSREKPLSSISRAWLTENGFGASIA